jgi:putative flippase GtrA
VTQAGTGTAPEYYEVPLKQQLFRFVLTGGFSGIIDFGLTVILGKVFGLPEFVAKAVGFICGTATAYLLNRRWTFQAAPSHRRLVAVWVLYLVTFAVQEGLFLGVLKGIGSGPFLHWVLAYVIAQGTATVINFVVQRTIIFRLI